LVVELPAVSVVNEIVSEDEKRKRKEREKEEKKLLYLTHVSSPWPVSFPFIGVVGAC